ncbi:hypothetical protein M2175_001205 [Bradyrhizobium elkanii]|uniref:hypothetical protein n=1 Tax=Bradyrhizobium TaxID=374 RepID=UPI002168397D|nr:MULTISPECIES: hypothetical protein [Bradyrhizobium]MCS3926174.1 hypothetical protein [Bradyrhizobium elkanii]MCS3966726.1 hypothetical protein [Bradyrhizobium japonicum]
MRSLKSIATVSGRFNTRETVAIEHPARFAISTTVGDCLPRSIRAAFSNTMSLLLSRQPASKGGPSDQLHEIVIIPKVAVQLINPPKLAPNSAYLVLFCANIIFPLA